MLQRIQAQTRPWRVREDHEDDVVNLTLLQWVALACGSLHNHDE